MRIEQLEYLAAVTQHGSLHRASKQLHLSPSALSESIHSLERELGVPMLERHRSGSRISREGRELLPIMAEILGGVAELKAAASDRARTIRTIRVGTVNAGTSALLIPAVQEFGVTHPETSVDVATMFQTEIEEGLLEGRLDVGLVNIFPGDDVPAELTETPLLRGEPVVCCRADDPLAELEEIELDELRARPFVTSRQGYIMHRLAQRLFGNQQPATTFSADGAEFAKLFVATGTGPTLLPDYSVFGDPLEVAGVIVARRLAASVPKVSMLLLRRKLDKVPPTIVDFEETFMRLARAHPQADDSGVRSKNERRRQSPRGTDEGQTRSLGRA